MPHSLWMSPMTSMGPPKRGWNVEAAEAAEEVAGQRGRGTSYPPLSSHPIPLLFQQAGLERVDERELLSVGEGGVDGVRGDGRDGGGAWWRRRATWHNFPDHQTNLEM